MVGKHNIIVRVDDIKFDLTVERNITIITGDSAIGKTYLVDSIEEYINLGKSSGITVQSDVQVDVGEGTLARAINQLKSNVNSIIFYDENRQYVLTKEFAEAVLGSDNYVVIINRRDIKTLPYSVKEIKSLVTINNKGHFETSLTELFNLRRLEKIFKPEIIVTEDKKSGYEFFSTVMKYNCVSAEGNGNISNKLETLKQYNDILIIVDGAAFGALYNDVLRYAKSSTRKIVIWAPESFEYLILKSGTVEHESLDDYLGETYNYADSCKFYSWEQYYVWLLNELCMYNNIGTYSKSSLNNYFKRKYVADEIIKNCPEEIVIEQG
jgi:hypothetical protein